MIFNMRENSILCIIPLYNIVQLDYWNSLIESIIATKSIEGIDFLLINNESQDDSLKEAEIFSKAQQRVFLVDNKVNNGSAGAFAQGIRYAKGHRYSFAYLIDQDTQFDAASVKSLLRASDLLGAEYSVLCSAVYASENHNLYLPHFRVMFDKFLCRFYPVKTNLKELKKIDAGGNTGVFINLEVIGDTNMDESFFYHMEDYDFCLRVNQIKPIYLVPESIIYHPNKYPKVSKLRQLVDDLFVVTLVKKKHPISCKNRNTIVVYKRNSRSKYLQVKRITTCIISFIFPQYSFRKTKEVIFPKTGRVL